MAIASTSRPIQKRLSLTPRVTGGFSRSEIPDPNDAIETYRRGHGGPQVEGAYVSQQMPDAGSNPTITANGQSALGANLALAQRGRDARQQYYAGEVARRAAAGNTGIAAQAPLTPLPMDPRFDALLEALAESGANRVSTGAVKFHDAPGFFDVQNTDSMAQQGRRDYLKQQDVSRLLDAMRGQR